MAGPIKETDFPELPLLKRGKVRDIYDLEDSLLMVASDRISAFDVIMPNTIPDKGRVLTQISLFWFDLMAPICDNHVISSQVEDYPEVCRPYHDVLRNRSMLVKKATPLPVECVVRGYISGSGWKSYLDNGSVCGIKLPDGLKESDPLPEPLFTPSTKAELGEHDENITFEETRKKIGDELAFTIKDLSLTIYNKGAEFARSRGIIIADTKFEFGLIDGNLVLIDEILTPDSSRFWPEESYSPGGSQKSFDKQYLRDWLLTLTWDKKPPAPHLPKEVIENTRTRYIEALTLLTGHAI